MVFFFFLVVFSRVFCVLVGRHIDQALVAFTVERSFDSFMTLCSGARTITNDALLYMLLLLLLYRSYNTLAIIIIADADSAALYYTASG